MTPGQSPSTTLVFPVCATTVCATAFRCARRPDGVRVALAFTTLDRLHAVMGPGQPWVPCCAEAAHTMLAPLGVAEIRVDPEMVMMPAREGRASA